MRAITHCNNCGQKTAVLAIRGEVASQFICQGCGEVFDQDNPPAENREFRTLARPQETRVERVERILGGQLGRKVRPASEMLFDYELATAVARGD